MTAKDLLHHVFPWEVTTGVERLGLDGSPSSSPAVGHPLGTATEQADSDGSE